MEMEKKEEGNKNGKGNDVKGRELVGGEEYTSEEKKNGRSGRVRRATFDDLEAIVDINDNVYEGLDYMPALFYTFMHSKLHVIYVYEEDSKLRSLGNFRFHPDSDDLVSAMSGRVHPTHQGRGLGDLTKTPIVTCLLKEHPLVTSYVEDATFMPTIAAKMKKLSKWKELYQWNLLVYKLPDRHSLSQFTHFREMALGAVRPFSLSYTKGTEWLERSDQLIRFVSKYVVNLFPVGSTWMPTPTNKSGLRHALSVANVYVSLDPASTIDNSCLSDPTSSRRHFQDAVSCPKTTTNKENEGDIIGLSYSTVLQCKYGIRIDIYFYGDCEEVFLSHVYSQLHHYVSMTCDDVRVGVLLHFPITINSKNMEERLEGYLGQRFDGDCYSVTRVVQYRSEFPQARL